MLTKEDVVYTVRGDWLFYAKPGDLIWLEKEQQIAKIDRGLHSVDPQGLGWIAIRRWLNANNKQCKPWTENWLVRKNGAGVDGRSLLLPLVKCPGPEDNSSQVLLSASILGELHTQMESQNARLARALSRLSGIESRLSQVEAGIETASRHYNSAREHTRNDSARLLMATQKLLDDVEVLISRTRQIKGPITDENDRLVRDIQLPDGS